MLNQIHCKNCDAPIIMQAKFCPECGNPTSAKRINFDTVSKDVVNTFLNTTNRLWFTFKSLLTNPGVCILDYVDGKRGKYQPPFSYFACSLVFYSIYKTYLMTFLYRLYVGTQLGDKTSLGDSDIYKELGIGLNLENFTLVGLLLGMALLGWLVCGLKWGERKKRTFNLTESIVVFTYIYGTNFFLDPIVVSVEIPFWLQIKAIAGGQIDLVTDIPLIILIAYMAYAFCKRAKISMLRYSITLVCGFFYYYYMSTEFKDWLIYMDKLIHFKLHSASLVLLGLMMRK